MKQSLFLPHASELITKLHSVIWQLAAEIKGEKLLSRRLGLVVPMVVFPMNGGEGEFRLLQ